jgi:hypothetical protein
MNSDVRRSHRGEIYHVRFFGLVLYKIYTSCVQDLLDLWAKRWMLICSHPSCNAKETSQLAPNKLLCQQNCRQMAQDGAGPLCPLTKCF